MKSLTYQELINKSEGRTVLIAFTASWSGSSQLLINMLELISEDLEAVTIGEIDVEEEESLVSNLGIAQVPTTLIVRERVVIDLFTGPVSRKQIMRKIGVLQK